MKKEIPRARWSWLVLCNLFAISLFSQRTSDLLFREDWKETPAELPVTQAHIAHSDLLLHLYGPGQDSIKKSHHDQPADDPYYIWSGRCRANWAVALSHKNLLIDLSQGAKIRWRTKQFGFRKLHLIVKQSSGDWLIADHADGDAADWRVTEFKVQDLNWRPLDISTITERNNFVRSPDLTEISHIGFTDLMIGGDSQACSRLDWIEVYAKGVPKS